MSQLHGVADFRAYRQDQLGHQTLTSTAQLAIGSAKPAIEAGLQQPPPPLGWQGPPMKEISQT